jgi:two-component system, chemotaxis family, chemotaxis protein CheY
MSILIVDDDGAIREMLIDTLRDEGFPSMGVSDGAEALAYLQASADLPCLILLDLMMPRMDGWQFLSARRGAKHLQPIPVVVLSARPDVEVQAQSLQVAGFIPKPIDFEQLFGAARRFCSHCDVAPPRGGHRPEAATGMLGA